MFPNATTRSTWSGVFGPNNGIKPIPAPGLDSGTTTLQKLVPVLPGGVPAPPQDGSSAPRTHQPHQTTPGGSQGNPKRLLPAPGGDDAPRARHNDRNNRSLSGLMPSLGQN
jgi:phospholipid/cholesterol/gamma-HCH transport system substrate-binding protein